ncbi:MAG TPA: hypothetical protein VG602_09690, partial [Actinomycetota bacterium]|nr:hypothetical protein [Actinomycetota bacterium]
MAEMVTATGFSKESIPAPAGESTFARDLRTRAFESFTALPVPSQETEEWRYTDLSELDLDRFEPHAAGGSAPNLDDLDDGILAAAGEVGERAGLLIQHNSDVATGHLDPKLAERGVLFMGLDRALAEHADLLEGRFHSLVPPDRTKFTALHA